MKASEAKSLSERNQPVTEEYRKIIGHIKESCYRGEFSVLLIMNSDTAQTLYKDGYNLDITMQQGADLCSYKISW